MSAVISDTHLMLLLPFLPALAAQAGVPKWLCLVARVVALLLSAENAAILDWMIGTAIAGIPIRERILHCRAVLSCRGAPRLARQD
jgi:hypothetical protein